ncbi:hypothetical protein MBLNU459_g8346t1 [Dothideomycetes sp. NU459]
MTSLAEYQHSMNSQTEGGDYQLYSYQAYQSIYAGHQPTVSTFDQFSIPVIYQQGQHDQSFLYESEANDYSKSTIPSYSPNYSPTNSIAHSFDMQPPVLSSTSDSGASVQSNISSAMGSPSIGVQQQVPTWNHLQGLVPSIVQQDSFQPDQFASTNYDFESAVPPFKGFVDPSLIQPLSPSTYSTQPYQAPLSPQNVLFGHSTSPAPSSNSGAGHRKMPTGVQRTARAASPYHQWNPYTTYPVARRQSVSSTHSHHSGKSHSSADSEELKGVCPIATCGRHIKDLKAHLLTHKNERPEKCPITSCEYNIKGFARKYDKNRHTLTHYKGTMVCGFCPGSGSASEKSFNRADVFKRHLTSVHGVEQTAPNSRKRSPGVSGTKRGYAMKETQGTCSTCSVTFANPQEFYEHLDDCVLRVVQQGDPSEAINERILSSVTHDKAVKETMERHMLSTSLDMSGPTSFDDEDDEDEDSSGESKHKLSGSRKKRVSSGQDAKPPTGLARVSSIDYASVHQGLTHSSGGVSISGAGKGSKRRKNYPLSWGAAPDKMRMKKRVLCVFDGPRRLWKDDMMLDAENEVRVQLPGGDGRRWVTDLDIQTLRRAEGLHNATEEEKGPWLDAEGNPIIY